MKLSRGAKIVFSLGFYFNTTIATNYIVHSLRAIEDAKEAENYPFSILENGVLRLSDEYKLMREHQRRTLEELKSLWVLVPGSFLWRNVERPNLEKRVDKVNNSPLHRT